MRYILLVVACVALFASNFTQGADATSIAGPKPDTEESYLLMIQIDSMAVISSRFDFSIKDNHLVGRRTVSPAKIESSEELLPAAEAERLLNKFRKFDWNITSAPKNDQPGAGCRFISTIKFTLQARTHDTYRVIGIEGDSVDIFANFIGEFIPGKTN